MQAGPTDCKGQAFECGGWPSCITGVHTYQILKKDESPLLVGQRISGERARGLYHEQGVVDLRHRWQLKLARGDAARRRAHKRSSLVVPRHRVAAREIADVGVGPRGEPAARGVEGQGWLALTLTPTLTLTLTLTPTQASCCSTEAGGRLCERTTSPSPYPDPTPALSLLPSPSPYPLPPHASSLHPHPHPSPTAYPSPQH